MELKHACDTYDQFTTPVGCFIYKLLTIKILFSLQAAKCTIQSQLYEFLDNVDTVPSAVILFTSGLLADNHSLKSFLTKTQEKLPVSCLVVGCDAGGVIGESSAGCLEEVEQNSPAMSVLLVPKINGVNVSLFSITRQEILDNKSNKQSWKKSFGIVVNQEIKFVLLIGQHDQQQMGKVVEGIKKVVLCCSFENTIS